MPWLLLLLALACLILTFITKSVAVGLCCMLFALVLMVVAMMMLLSSRVSGTARSNIPMSPDELRELREQAEARRAAQAKASPSDAGRPAPDASRPPSG